MVDQFFRDLNGSDVTDCGLSPLDMKVRLIFMKSKLVNYPFSHHVRVPARSTFSSVQFQFGSVQILKVQLLLVVRTQDMKTSWIANMDTVKQAILDNHGFIWQMMVNNGTGTHPLVGKISLLFFSKWCQKSSLDSRIHD